MDEDLDEEPLPFSGYDPNSEAWFANLLFWRPSRFSDERMQLHFKHWDGCWSEQTKDALKRFEAKGLDLNENWVLSAPYWSCPACHRSKSDIFRLSKRGILLAKLELHHDHMRDYIWPRIRELFGDDWLETRPKSSIIVLDHVRELTCRFDVCLVCSECNAADGKVKAKFRGEIDERFSFTALEIETFIRPSPGKDHEVDYDKAFDAWEGEKDNFQTRLALIDELLNHLAHGRLSREHRGVADARIVGGAFDARDLLLRSFEQDTKNTERAGLLWAFRDEFLSRSTRRDSETLPSTDRTRRAIVAPTDDEYAGYVDPVSPKSWQAIADDWACPICARNKRGLLRKSKSGNWSGGVRLHSECTLEEDELAIANRRKLFPDFRNDIFVRDIIQIRICADCAGIGASLEHKDRSIRDPYLSISDRRSCIANVEPHSAHEIDFEAASQRARANEPYGPASEAFTAFRTRVRDFTARFERGRRWGATEDDLLKEFADDLRVYHHIENPAAGLSLAKWLLKQSSSEESVPTL